MAKKSVAKPMAPAFATARVQVLRIAKEMDRAVRHSWDVRDAIPTDLVDIWQRQLRELMGDR